MPRGGGGGSLDPVAPDPEVGVVLGPDGDEVADGWDSLEPVRDRSRALSRSPRA